MPRTRKWPKVMACAFVSVIAASSVATAAEGDVIIDWNKQALDAVRDNSVGTPDAARLYAMVNAAMYDAVNGIDRARGHGREKALVLPPGAPRRGNQEAAAVGAAYTVLSNLVPGSQDEYNHQLHANLGDLGGGKAVTKGFDWGVSVGHAVLENRSNDGSRPKQSATYGDGPGDFRGTFGSVQYAGLTPFAIDDPEDYTSDDGPPDLDSPAYAVAYYEVRLLGDGRVDDEESLNTVCFWQGTSGSGRPPGEWIKVTGIVAEQERTTEDISETARLFALQGLAMGDAVIPSWISKDEYGFWRPQTAINEGDTDGNGLTAKDEDWVPRNGGRGSSPEHTSGQSTFAGAGSTILAGFYGDNVTFSFAGDPGRVRNEAGENICPEQNVEREYDNFTDAAQEAGGARILAGIHFEFSNQAGQASGRGLATEILNESLQPCKKRGKRCGGGGDGDDEDDD